MVNYYYPILEVGKELLSFDIDDIRASRMVDVYNVNDDRPNEVVVNFPFMLENGSVVYVSIFNDKYLHMIREYIFKLEDIDYITNCRLHCAYEIVDVSGDDTFWVVKPFPDELIKDADKMHEHFQTERDEIYTVYVVTDYFLRLDRDTFKPSKFWRNYDKFQ